MSRIQDGKYRQTFETNAIFHQNKHLFKPNPINAFGGEKINAPTVGKIKPEVIELLKNIPRRIRNRKHKIGQCCWLILVEFIVSRAVYMVVFTCLTVDMVVFTCLTLIWNIPLFLLSFPYFCLGVIVVGHQHCFILYSCRFPGQQSENCLRKSPQRTSR